MYSDMKNIFLILFLFVVQAGISQSMVVWVDYHDPVKGKGSELREAVGDKTKKYNQGPGTFQLYTFEVISGPRQGQLARAGVGPKWADFDNNSVTSEEFNYWMKNVDPMIASSSGREYFERVDDASHDQSKPGEKVVGLNIHYVMAPGSDRNHFWKFRGNLASAIKESGEDLTVNVWRSRGGGEQGHVQVSFAFRTMEEYGNFYKVMSKVGDTYQEMFGEDSWETDLDLLRGTIQMWGARTELVRFLPELSSPPIALQ